MLVALIDTNVVVSGVLAGAGPSPNARIVDAMISGRLRFVLSQALLTEYRRVLLRPAIACRHGLSEADVDRLLEDLVVNAMVREPPDPGEAESPAGGDLAVPGDEHVLALLRAAPGAVLVSGNLRLRDAVVSWGSAVSPAEFAAGFA